MTCCSAPRCGGGRCRSGGWPRVMPVRDMGAAMLTLRGATAGRVTRREARNDPIRGQRTQTGDRCNDPPPGARDQARGTRNDPICGTGGQTRDRRNDPIRGQRTQSGDRCNDPPPGARDQARGTRNDPIGGTGGQTPERRNDPVRGQWTRTWVRCNGPPPGARDQARVTRNDPIGGTGGQTRDRRNDPIRGQRPPIWVRWNDLCAARETKLGARATTLYAAVVRAWGRGVVCGCAGGVLVGAKRVRPPGGRLEFLGWARLSREATNWQKPAEVGLHGNDPIGGPATVTDVGRRGARRDGWRLAARRRRGPAHPRGGSSAPGPAGGDGGLGQGAGRTAGDRGDAKWGLCATTLYAACRAGAGRLGWVRYGRRPGDEGGEGLVLSRSDGRLIAEGARDKGARVGFEPAGRAPPLVRRWKTQGRP